MLKLYKRGITLAETMMTLVMIGVIAVIILPGLNENINTTVLEKQKLVFDKNFNTALSAMQLRGELAKHYNSTEEFVQQLSKYIKITQTCDANKLTNCFADKIMQNKKNVKYITKDLKTSSDINVQFSEASDLVSLVFADGTRALITYDKNCLVENRFDNDADVTACMAMLYDVNGNDPPNVWGNDIKGLNLGAPSSDDIEVFDAPAYTAAQCNEAVSNGAPIPNCGNDNDYFAGAVDSCYQKNMRLPSKNELNELLSQLYGQTVTSSGDSQSFPSGGISDMKLWKAMGGKSIILFIAPPYPERVSATSKYGTYGRSITTSRVSGDHNGSNFPQISRYECPYPCRYYCVKK